jgi:membrane protease YdiL (CAAX protease family)
MLEDITSMMSIMCTFIAPVVLGITVALQRVISSALGSVSGKLASDSTGTTTANVGGVPTGLTMPAFGSKEVATFDQNLLLAVIAIYMIEIVIVLMYFASQVTEGENDLSFKMYVSTALPIAISVFFLVAFIASMMIPA